METDDSTNRVKIGLESLQTNLPAVLKGARVGLLAHAASRLPRGEHALEVLQDLNLNVVRLFGPEHGFLGAAGAGEKVADAVYDGRPLVSLYGVRRAPEPGHLHDLDALVFDVQDVGVRAYTYLSTLKACLTRCAEVGVTLVLLDRPNPLGRAVYGAGVTAGFESFVSAHDVPFVHGLTLGELATLIARDLGADNLHVVKMTGYDSSPWSEHLPWRAPSPNLPHLTSARLYPLTVFLEGTPISEGRGTDAPFEQLGAPWLDGDTLANALNGQLTGLHAEPVRFTPVASKHAGAEVFGVKLRQTGPFDPLRGARVLLSEMRRQNPDTFSWLGEKRPFIDLLAGSEVLRRTVDGDLGEAEFETWLRTRESVPPAPRLYF